MLKADSSWKTPLGYYEKAIEELRRGREELQEAKTAFLQSVESKPTHDTSEIEELKLGMQNTQEKLRKAEEIAAETQRELATARNELQTLKNMIDNEKNFNEKILTEITAIKSHINNIFPQTQENIQQSQNDQVLLDLKSKLVDLTEELTLVSYISGTNYRILQKLLIEQKWREADQFTYSSILRACDREQEGWLADGDIKKIPRHDLYIINQLWSKHSEGHFSFAIQKNIWQSQRSFEDFAIKIGWMKLISNHHKFLNYDDYTFSLEAPQGNFPCTAKLVGLGYRSTSGITNRIKSFLTWY